MTDHTITMSKTATSPQFAVATLSISGMTCASCSNDIKHGLETLDIVKSSSISALSNSGTVIFDQTLPGSILKIIELIEDKGYDCTLQSLQPLDEPEKNHTIIDTKRRTIDVVVEGMFCSQCPSRIINSLTQRYGDGISVTQPSGFKEPVLSISYLPASSSLTVRSIIAHVQNMNPSFHVRIYHPPSTEDESNRVHRREKRATLWRLALSAILAIPTLFVGVIWMSLVPGSDGARRWFEQAIWSGNVPRAQWILFFLATPVYFLSGSKFHAKSLREIYFLWRPRSKTPILPRFYRFGSMNLLISAGTSVAYFSSVILLIFGATSQRTGMLSTYFDSVVFLTFFILVGRYLEAVSKAKAGNAISMLGELRPMKALLVVPVDELNQGSHENTSISHEITESPTNVKEVSLDLLEIGDTVIVPHGSTPPADGILLSSEGQFDESSLTGESAAVKKSADEKIFLGTINIGNPIKMIITDLGGTSMLDQIIAVVREGQTKQAPMERIADSITAYFVPIITLLAIVTFFVWLGLGQSGFLDQKYLTNPTGGWAFFALEFAIAVFVVACPCGIGLAAPTALYVGSGLAAKAGILVRGGGEAFQDASHLDAIVFDKTGTLTEGGDLQVTDHEMLETEIDLEQPILWTIIRILEESSSHPIAKAIATTSTKHQSEAVESLELSEIPGKGMSGIFTTPTEGKSRTFEAILGSESLIQTHTPYPLDENTFVKQILSTWKQNCKSIAILAVHETNTDKPWYITTLFALSDPIRPSAAPAIAALQAKGIRTYMLSGDNQETARAVAMTVGIPVANVFAGALPQDKAERIARLKKDLSHPARRSWFHKSNTDETTAARIAFVGDGINDAPALLAATVSISLSTGSPIALTSSSFILLTPSLETIITLLSLSKKVFRRIKWNFAWALIYNIVLIPVAAGIFFRVRADGFILGPVWAAAAMALSSVSVVLASLAMRWGL